jgi:transcriptional regulator GlxA family with amidase domain
MALDLIGPSEAFGSAVVEEKDGSPRHAYEIVVLGLTQKPFTAANTGVVFKPHATLDRAPKLDTLIVPGGPGLREPAINARVAAWLKEHASGIPRIASVCTGIYGLAAAGLLDGRRATTHWNHAQDVAHRFPRVRLDSNALYIRDGRFYTSAGITAGIDLALALIEEDLGPGVALAVARELVVYLKRPGGQEQFSEPLRFQSQSKDRFADLAAWIGGHLRHDLSVEALAERTFLSPRQFNRRFRQAFGVTPADFVERMRLDEARRRLAGREQRIETVADSVGFHSADAFRRAFERRFGVNPSNYRERFATPRANGRANGAIADDPMKRTIV